ncbi:MAG: T9SS type A sorting domain-containing protein [candidate division Zixibacteria bacterium]
MDVRRLSPLIATIISILAFVPARADYHYASHEGSDEYPYTSWETAAWLVQDALDASESYDTVYVGSGEYYEQIEMQPVDSCVTIIGAGMDSTLIWTDVNDILFRRAQRTSFFDLGFRHLGTYAAKILERRYLTGPNTHLYVNRCRFSGGLNVTAIKGLTDGVEIIENCVFDTLKAYTQVFGCSLTIFRNNLCYTIPGNISNIFVQGTKLVFENNIFTLLGPSSTILINPSSIIDTLIVRQNLINNFARAIGVLLNSRHGSNFSFNIFDTNVYASLPAITIAVGAIDSTVHFDIFNNSFRGVPVILRIIDSAPDPRPIVSLDYNNIWDVVDVVTYEYPGYFDSVGNIYCEPMYVGEGDYHLQAYSPLIDAGDPGLFDIDGTRSDIGIFGGPGGSSYEYLDLPPWVPASLSASLHSDSIFITWAYNFESDFNRYQIHRETYSGFEPSMFNLIAEPDTSYYVDTDWLPENNYFYRIAAVDNQDNLSEYSEELAVITTGINGGFGAEMPTITTIRGNYPNPFNSRTTIIYTVANLGPMPAQINIDIYDILGRKVCSLIDERKEVGTYRITWDGKNDDGSDCPSGVYFTRITQWNVDYLNRYKKLMLLR